MNMQFIRKLPIPQEIKEQYPVSADAAAIKQARDKEIRAIFCGDDPTGRMLLVIGPCSADNTDAVLTYIEKLTRLQARVADRFLLIPRVYTGKPRTAGEGYMGMLHQPDPSGKEDILRGIVAVRELYRRILCELGMTCADEMLYPDNHRYLSDLLSYVAVGARSVENQQHRLTASGLEIPVGMKNPTGGDLGIMVNAIRAAHLPHRFIYRGWEVESRGNPLAHAILRGAVNEQGEYVPNYDEQSLLRCVALHESAGLSDPSVVVDVNHANSGKQYLAQGEIAHAVLAARRNNPVLRRAVKGLMIESYLYDGAQTVQPGADYLHGMSITDGCLGWEKTEALVLSLAEEV